VGPRLPPQEELQSLLSKRRG